MRREREQKSRARITHRRYIVWWVGGLILLAAAGFSIFWFVLEPTTPVGPDPSELAGRWLRPDGGYILQLSDPGPDGKLKAAYFNPRPIHVAHAEWKHQEGRLGAFVELRAPNYPGSTYTLEYDPAKDLLLGIYFQAVTGQQFYVEFNRTPEHS